MTQHMQDQRRSLRRGRASQRKQRPATHLERRLHAFLTGDSDGRDLLEALYSDVLEEPVPERLLALLRR